jgi:hypothetical protein
MMNDKFPITANTASPSKFPAHSKFKIYHLKFLLGLTYGLALCLLSLRPLAGFADAPNQRQIAPDFIAPPPDAKTFLVQEVQSAYFHPELLHISTEGLISPEAYNAYKQGKTLYEFIMETRADLIGFGNYPIRDPDGIQTLINNAAVAGQDLQFRDLTLKYLGQLPGAGPVFAAHYGNHPNPGEGTQN